MIGNKCGSKVQFTEFSTDFFKRIQVYGRNQKRPKRSYPREQKMKSTLALFAGLLTAAALAQSTGELSTDAINRGQSLADAVLAASGADAAFFASGLLKEGTRGDLASQCLYPTDEIMVVELTGAQVKAALERSVSLHPSPNPGFLYLAGIEATFKPKAPADARIADVVVNGSPLSPAAKYKVAMPGSLARGGLGYFSIWDKTAIQRTVEGQTVEAVVKGKTAVSSPSRWKAAGGAESA